MEHLPRTADRVLARRPEALGAVNAVGPKGCGKTTTAEQQAASVAELKPGSHEVEDGARRLCEIEGLVGEHNGSRTRSPIRPPDLKLAATGTGRGFGRDGGVSAIPAGRLAP